MRAIDRANEMLSAQLNSVSGLLCHTGTACACVCVCVCASCMSHRHMSHPHYTLFHRSQDQVEVGVGVWRKRGSKTNKNVHEMKERSADARSCA